MKSSYLIALVIALVAAGWLASAYIGDTSPGDNKGADLAAEPATPATKAPMRVQVRNSVAEIRAVSLVLTGQTEPSRYATLKAETAARVVAVEAKEGAMIKKDDVVVQLAMDERKALLDEARAVVKQRQVEYTAASKLSRSISNVP
jgi:multidrug efflux system membrane fusion protein